MVIENMELLQRYSEPPISFYNKLITVVTGDNLKVQSKHEKRIASFFRRAGIFVLGLIALFLETFCNFAESNFLSDFLKVIKNIWCKKIR